jgi:hypothetical protein
LVVALTRQLLLLFALLVARLLDPFGFFGSRRLRRG